MEVFLSKIAGCQLRLSFFFSPGTPESLTFESITPWQKCTEFKVKFKNYKEGASKQNKFSFSKHFNRVQLVPILALPRF